MSTYMQSACVHETHKMSRPLFMSYFHSIFSKSPKMKKKYSKIFKFTLKQSHPTLYHKFIFYNKLHPSTAATSAAMSLCLKPELIETQLNRGHHHHCRMFHQQAVALAWYFHLHSHRQSFFFINLETIKIKLSAHKKNSLKFFTSFLDRDKCGLRDICVAPAGEQNI